MADHRRDAEDLRPPVAVDGEPDPGGERALGRIEHEDQGPAFQPSSRTTLDAPGLPEPSVVTSTPPRRATSSALGNVPRRYAKRHQDEDPGHAPLWCVDAAVGARRAAGWYD